MPSNSDTRRIDDPAIAERAVVLQVLAETGEDRLSRAALGQRLADIAPDALDGALLRLEHTGVLERSGETVRASDAARRLDELELIGV
jgi:hypothetical protein